MRIDPGADAFLRQHRLGAIRQDTVKEQNGRNNNFLVVTDLDNPVFVKRIRPGNTDAAERFAACVAFDDLCRADSNMADTLGTAPLLASDAETGFLAYRAVTGAKSVSELLVDADREQALTWADGCGGLLAAVHQLDPSGVPDRSTEPPLPPIDWLTALPWGVYSRSSAPALQVWHRLQHDDAAREALVRLRADERAATGRSPIHGDARLDQLLVGKDGVLRLIDMEEFRLGDSARDVGAMVGEWLHRATLELVRSDETEAAVLELELSHEEVLRRGVAALESWRPVISRFWNSYRAHGAGNDDPEYIGRVTRFAGWHLFDRLIAAAESTSRLSALQWGAAGIGRQALLNPLEAAGALGLPACHTTKEHAA